jgi:Radial spokehead-like protein
VVIQSLLWPGFYTIVNTEKQRWSHLYLGLGLKFRQPYIPDKIQEFLAEPKDLTEIPEVDFQVY